MMNYLISRCTQLLYDPHPQLSVDESMIGTKCRLSFIQYMPKKPVKWGVKVWVLADSVTVTGYMYNFDVYCGANSSEQPHPKGLAYGVVMKLLQPCLKKWVHCVYGQSLFRYRAFQGFAANGYLMQWHFTCK